jgi:Arylsulfotransferase (ASST)
MEGGAPGGWLRAWLLAAAFFAVLAAPAGAATALHVIPFPGTPDASPLSHIIFSSLQPSQLESVSVTGAKSGPHLGHLVALPDGAGTAFVPDARFMAGEQVSVTATLTSPAAGTASGDPGATTLDFSFTTGLPARLGPAEGPEPPGAAADRPTSRSNPPAPPTQHFRSAPGVRPPIITSVSGRATSGDILLAPNTLGISGPMILDRQGRLVWFRPVFGVATNLQVQRYRGQPVLTWWQGEISGGRGVNGQDVIMSRSYRTLKVLHAAYGYSSDLHEFQLTPRGTALIDAFVHVEYDLSGVGGQTQAPLNDAVIQELDVKTGQVLWEWHALGHIALNASYAGPPGIWYPWEFMHLNSIQELPSGNLLISGRDTWGVYEIDKQTGHVIWTLGGRDPSFKQGPGTNFEWQHDAHLYPNGTLSLFDDAADPQKERQSSAKLLAINPRTGSASLVRRYTHSPPLITGAVGSAQVLPNHDMLVGWGTTGQFSEYTRSGKQIFNGSLPLPVYSYRVYEFPWSGQPQTPPSLALGQSDGKLKAYASWNGATQVSSWRVLEGSHPGSLRSTISAGRTGFETVLALQDQPRYVAVQALGSGGRVLGTSTVHVVGQ